MAKVQVVCKVLLILSEAQLQVAVEEAQVLEAQLQVAVEAQVLEAE
jgi:hypothetical protein